MNIPVYRVCEVYCETPSVNGLLYRYRLGDEGMEGNEGVFLACSFWLAECMAMQGRVEEAHKIFKRAKAAGNDPGLFAEEYSPQTGEMLGNFPQAFTHLSLIAAATALTCQERDD